MSNGGNSDYVMMACRNDWWPNFVTLQSKYVFSQVNAFDYGHMIKHVLVHLFLAYYHFNLNVCMASC